DLSPEKEESPEYKDYNIYSFESLLKLGEKALKDGCSGFTGAEIDRDKPCAYLFTSGTTGTSKAVMLSHRNIASNAANAACCAAFGFNDTMVMVLPMHHSYETTCTFFASSMLGSHLCQNESIKMVMRNFQHYKPDKLALVPLFVDTMMKRIWDNIEQKGKTKTVRTMIKVSNALRKIGIDLRKKIFGQVLGAFGGNLNAIIAGGAPLNPSHIRDMDAFGIALWQGYGITECSPLVAVMPGDMHLKKSKSVGYPVFQNEVKIIDKDEEGNGEIVVKGENVMLGYLDDEEATKEVFTEDGFFRTGDIGYLDSDGYLYINGRKKNLIILSNGKNIYPEEIEEYLYKIEGVKECAVTERKRQSGEDNITALIFPDFELEKFKNKAFEEIEKIMKAEVDNINKQLPVYKQVTEVEVRKTEFEKTTTRKIMRHKLN
ncbi:MAG: AMP-binding protein, partial [Oscillospiraceae bacterium]|nr:AMP-binding protein [Oscillospiraceae bacterium]